MSSTVRRTATGAMGAMGTAGDCARIAASSMDSLIMERETSVIRADEFTLEWPRSWDDYWVQVQTLELIMSLELQIRCADVSLIERTMKFVRDVFIGLKEGTVYRDVQGKEISHPLDIITALRRDGEIVVTRPNTAALPPQSTPTFQSSGLSVNQQ